ncbi:carbohydrate kinase family protein [Candidatus Daviesbacteria bacterium]|nr:carbohydrate kinase family protein [Candidatus Daviesbacteria bacterium]
MFDLISIGDVTIDTFIPLINAKLIKDPEDNQLNLSLRYGDKIPVGPSVSMVAGNGANAAVAASRLKLKTAAYLNIGNGEDGVRIKHKFKEENVDTRYIVFNKNLPSNHSVILDFKGNRTILVYHQPWKYNLPELDKAKWIYLTSLSPSFIDSNILDQIINYLERTNAKLLYNPGTFQIKLGVKKKPRLLSLVDVLIVNKEEAKLILGFDGGKTLPIKKLLKELADLGPRNIIITDGAEGSYGYNGENFFKLGIFKANLVQVTGAGDGFASGTLAGLFYGKSLMEAMRWGAANSASVIEHIGAQAGLLSYNQIQERLKENSKIITEEI